MGYHGRACHQQQKKIGILESFERHRGYLFFFFKEQIKSCELSQEKINQEDKCFFLGGEANNKKKSVKSRQKVNCLYLEDSTLRETNQDPRY